MRHCATGRNVAGSIFGLKIFSAITFRQYYDCEVDSVPNINDYQKYFVGGKGGWCMGLTTLPP